MHRAVQCPNPMTGKAEVIGTTWFGTAGYETVRQLLKFGDGLNSRREKKKTDAKIKAQSRLALQKSNTLAQNAPRIILVQQSASSVLLTSHVPQSWGGRKGPRNSLRG